MRHFIINRCFRVVFLKEGLKIHLWYSFEGQIKELYPRSIKREFMELEARKLNFLFFSLFFNFILFLNLKHCISFAKHQNESATGIHVLPILNPPPSSLPTPSLWVVLVHQPQASSIVRWTWTGNSFHTWYYTCFNAILPNHPTLCLSNRVHKTVLYISVSFAVWYTGLLLPSF